MRNLCFVPVVALFLFVCWAAKAALPREAQVQLASACYSDKEVLKGIFKTGIVPPQCELKVVDRGSKVPIPGLVPSTHEIHTHLVGKLGSLVSESPDKVEATLAFFTMVRCPERDIRDFAIKVFTKNVYLQLNFGHREELKARLRNLWNGHRRSELQREVLIQPLMLVQDPETAARWIREAYTKETVVAVRQKMLEALVSDINDFKRSNARVQDSLILFLSDPTPSVRDEAIIALSENWFQQEHSERYVRRVVTNMLTPENEAKVVALLDPETSLVATQAALKVLGRQHGSRYIDQSRANQDLALHERLARLLESPNPGVRVSVAEAYSRIHPAQPLSQIALIRALDDENEQVRSLARKALEAQSDFNHKPKLVAPEVFSEVIALILSSDEETRAAGLHLLKQSQPGSLRTIVELAEAYPKLIPLARPIVLDSFRAAAARKVALEVGQGESELYLLGRLRAALATGPLADESEVKGLLKQSSLPIAALFQELASNDSGTVEEAAVALAQNSASEVRKNIHNHSEQKNRQDLLGVLIREGSPIIKLALVGMLAHEDLRASTGRYPQLFLAMAEAAVAKTENDNEDERRDLAAKVFIGFAQKSNQLNPLRHVPDQVLPTFQVLIEQAPADLALAMIACYTYIAGKKDVTFTPLLANLLLRHNERAVHLAAAKVLRARVPWTSAEGLSLVARAYLNANAEDLELRKLLLEVLIGSYPTILAQPALFELQFAQPIDGMPTAYSEAAQELLAFLNGQQTGEVSKDGPLHRCAVSITRN